jgi:hypothetical protein
MNCPWIIHGLSIDYRWIIHGISMDSQKIIHGNPWTILRLSMNYLLTTRRRRYGGRRRRRRRHRRGGGGCAALKMLQICLNCVRRVRVWIENLNLKPVESLPGEWGNPRLAAKGPIQGEHWSPIFRLLNKNPSRRNGNMSKTGQETCH